MRNRKLPLILLLMLGIGIFSCQKLLTDHLEEDKALVGNPALLSEVKKFYQKELRSKMTSGIDKRRNALGATQKASARRQTASVPKTQVYALWKMSKMSTFQGKKDIIEVPILSSRRTVSVIKIARDSLGYTPDRTMVRSIFDRLIISRGKGSETFHSQIVRYHPDRGYLEKHRYDMSHVHLYGLDGFTGYLEYLTVEGERKAVVRVVDGKPVRRYYMGAKQPRKKNTIFGRGPGNSLGGMRASSGGGDEICEEVCEDIYDEVCTGSDPDDPEDTTCELVAIDYDCWEECVWIDDDPEFCQDNARWFSSECDDEDEEEEEIVPRDKAPTTYHWRNLLVNAEDWSSHLHKETPLYITLNGNEVKNPEAYNCHYHTFGSIHPSDPGFDSDWPKWPTIPDNRNYSEVPTNSPIEVGDRVIYFDIAYGEYGVTHSGIVMGVDNEGYATIISSKMGEYEILEHHPRDIPPAYGSTDPSIDHNGEEKPTRRYFRGN